MASRIAALLLAVVMVVGAIAVRDRLEDGDGGGSNGDGDGPRLVCSTELRTACEALARSRDVELTVEPAGTTAARLIGHRDGEGPVDGWLTPAPWPDIVREARQRAGLEPLLRSGPVLARSPLVLAAWPDRADVLRARCATTNLWRCVGDLAGAPWPAVGGQAAWGQVKPGHAEPAGQAVGLSVIGAATAGFFARHDLSRLDLEANDDFRAWFTRLERAVPTFDPSAETPLEDMVLKGPAAFDVVATTEAEAGPLLARTARAGKPVVIYPSPVATADVALATLPGGRAERLAQQVGGSAGQSALAEIGWRVAGRPSAAGVPADPPLPPASGLPAPGVLDALRQVWREVTGR